MKKYYVYIRPGYIEYTDDFEKACSIADDYGCCVKLTSNDDIVYGGD